MLDSDRIARSAAVQIVKEEIAACSGLSVQGAGGVGREALARGARS
jgi:hypothetical protein